MFKNYCHICNQRRPIYVTVKFHTKIRILKFITKNFYLGVLQSNFEKLLPFCNQPPQIFLIAKFVAKTKTLHLGPKMPNLAVFGLKFENAVVVIEIRALEITLFQSLV